MDLDRQSFLGQNSDELLATLTVCIIGLGGGGSHIAQQLAHVGIGNFILMDFDRIDTTNLNRLVGATDSDARKKRYKADVLAKRIKAINPNVRVKAITKPWQEVAEHFGDCDVIFGCVDSFLVRRDIEAAARRYLVPYIDIGMDVHALDGEFAIGGQIALSMPDSLCLQCMGVITDALISEEVARYGDAGSRPQVVWANGVLASLAVEVFIQTFIPWHKESNDLIYLEYDGNLHEVRPSLRIPYLPTVCTHFDSINSFGNPFFTLNMKEKY